MELHVSSLGYLNVENRVKQLRFNYAHKIFKNIKKLMNITNTIQDQVILTM
jgi:hypothetical protein